MCPNFFSNSLEASMILNTETRRSMYKEISILIATVIGLVAFSGYSVSAQITMDYGNSKIDRNIRSEILSLPYYGVFDAIGYRRNGSTVTLSGFVNWGSTKDSAEANVKDVDGVNKVINNIEILPPSPSDDRIRRRTLDALANRGGSLFYYFLGTNPSIRIIVNHGRITLEGFVNNKADWNQATILAKGVPGTFGVTNNLQIIRVSN